METDDGYAFRAGTTYLVNIKLAFDTTKGYCANYKTVGGENIVGPDTFSATVNGVPATIRTSAQYFPTLQVSLTLEGERRRKRRSSTPIWRGKQTSSGRPSGRWRLPARRLWQSPSSLKTL